MARTRASSAQADVVSFSHLASSDLEGEISDLANAAGVVADLAEVAFAAPATIAGNGCYLLSPAQASRLQFAILQVLSRAERLRDGCDEQPGRLGAMAA